MIRCIIVDDESHALDILEHHTNQTPQLQLMARFTNPIEALQFLGSHPVDLVFLDIQMPELSGIDFIKAIHGKCKVILTTAYSEFALEGYELYVVDYLLKPIRLPRFLNAVQKAAEQIAARTPVQHAAEEDYIFVKTEAKGKVLKINLAEIDYIESLRNYVAIHRGTQKTLVLATLKDLEEQLPKKQFVRVHKSFIIPVSNIVGIEGNMVHLKNVKSGILLGDSYKPELMEIIKRRMIQ